MINIENLKESVEFLSTIQPSRVKITDTAFYRNPNYHKSSDTIDTLDCKRMGEVVHGVYHYVVSL